MPLKDITRDAVEAAVAEFAALGRDEFLKKYGFRHARAYLLETASGPMDSKAIVGAAHGFVPGLKALRADEFSGGDATVASLLQNLGFRLVGQDADALGPPVFREGETYNRRREIHGVLGGQQQGGISTPTRGPYVFLFTGEQGTQHGYRDGWHEGMFLYTGEGQVGDMQFRAGNRAIRDHRADRKDLVLLEATQTKGSYRCLGTFECVGWELQPRPDRTGAIRQAIVFQLQKVEGSAEDTPTSDVAVELDLATLRSRAFASAVIQKGPRNSSRIVHARSEVVKAYVLRRAGGNCEACGSEAPFETAAGTPYLEPHHIDRLSDGGLDRPDVVAAVCPTCHRRIHHGADGRTLNDRLRQAIAEKEDALDSSNVA